MNTWKSKFGILLILVWAPSRAAEPSIHEVRPMDSSISLCVALENIQAGDSLVVSVEGILTRSNTFFDPLEPTCQSGLAASTLVKLQEVPPGLGVLLERDGRAWVRLKGELLGPEPGKPDDPTLPSFQSLANLRRPRGYGQYEAYRTKFIVSEIWEVTEVAELPSWKGRNPEAPLFPRVTKAEVPVAYPAFAHSLGIEGEVVVQVTVIGGIVSKTEVISGDRLLTEDTLANIRTWSFDRTVGARFTTTFAYRLEKTRAGATSIEVISKLPLRIEILAPWKPW